MVPTICHNLKNTIGINLFRKGGGRLADTATPSCACYYLCYLYNGLSAGRWFYLLLCSDLIIPAESGRNEGH